MSMTAVEPTGINVAGKVSLYFVPAIANTAAPKLTEMNAVASCNISRVVYAWDPNGSQGVTERSHYGSEFAGTMLGRAKFDPAELEYDDDPQGAGVAAEYAHLGKLTPGLTGFLVDRRGIHIDTALAAGQKVDIYPVEIGALNRVPIDPTSTDGQKLRDEFRVFVTGEVKHGVSITA